jgi:hypothetical protein
MVVDMDMARDVAWEITQAMDTETAPDKNVAQLVNTNN